MGRWRSQYYFIKKMWIERIKHSFQLKYFQLHRNLFSMKEEEDIVFRQSLKALEKNRENFLKFGSGVEDTIYEFQIFVEFLVRFQKELKISNANCELISEGFSELSGSFKLLCSGYYLDSGIHLRRFIEKNVNWLNGHKMKNFEGKGMMKKLNEIFEKGEVGYRQNILPKAYVSEDIIYPLFSYLSHNHTHNGKMNTHLSFDESKFDEGLMLTIFSVRMIARLIDVALGDTMDPYEQNKIQSPVIEDEKPWYFSYIQGICGRSFFSYPETFLFNFMRDSLGKKLLLEEMKFVPEEIFSAEYLESHSKYLRNL